MKVSAPTFLETLRRKVLVIDADLRKPGMTTNYTTGTLGPINDVAQALSDPQIVARNMVVAVDDPVVGRVTTASTRICHVDAFVRAFGDVRKRTPVEHHGHRFVVASHHRLEVGEQAAGRSRPITPPAVGARADHVHRVDDEVAHARSAWHSDG